VWFQLSRIFLQPPRSTFAPGGSFWNRSIAYSIFWKVWQEIFPGKNRSFWILTTSHIIRVPNCTKASCISHTLGSSMYIQAKDLTILQASWVWKPSTIDKSYSLHTKSVASQCWKHLTSSGYQIILRHHVFHTHFARVNTSGRLDHLARELGWNNPSIRQTLICDCLLSNGFRGIALVDPRRREIGFASMQYALRTCAKKASTWL